MNPERWQRLKEVYQEALDKDDLGRVAYLEEIGRADSDLKKEVEVLLKSYGRDSFLEMPVYEAVPELFESQTSKVLIGSQLGP